MPLTATVQKSAQKETLPLDEPLPPKWLDLLDIPVLKLKRVLVQNYYTGQIKPMREASAHIHTDPLYVDEKGREPRLHPPGWRKLSKQEGGDLWKVATYLSYYTNRAVYFRNIYKIQKQNAAAWGGEVKDIDLLEDRKDLEKAVKANRCAVARDKAAESARHYSDMEKTLNLYLLTIARTKKKDRDVEFTRLSEEKVLNEEMARETARKMIQDQRRKA